MSKLEKVGEVILLVITVQMVFLSCQIDNNNKATQQKLDKIIKQLEHENSNTSAFRVGRQPH